MDRVLSVPRRGQELSGRVRCPAIQDGAACTKQRGEQRRHAYDSKVSPHVSLDFPVDSLITHPRYRSIDRARLGSLVRRLERILGREKKLDL